jgi:DHA1 family bicyclomycin/chloramphenicol resistance-like MFS transporter
VRDVFGREHAARALAYLGAAMGIIPGLAPIVGGILLTAFNWQAIFVLMIAIAAVTLFGLVSFFHETNQSPDPEALNLRRMAANYREMVGQRVFMGFALTAACAIGGLVMFLSGSPHVIITQHGVAADEYGYLFAAIVFSFTIGTLTSGRLTLRLGIERMVLIGALIGVASGVAQAGLAWAGHTSLLSLLIPQGFYMISLGFVLPNALAGAIGPYPTRAGTASALVGFIQLTLAATITIGMAYAFGWTQMSMATGLAVMTGLSLLAFWSLAWRARDRYVIDPAEARATEQAYRIGRRPG